LYTSNDVGKKKVDCAIQNSKFHNVGNTIIEGHDMNALTNFDKIVELAKQATAIFNLIDHGDYWDAAIQSLCLKLNLPHIVGGNFACCASFDFYRAQGKPCFVCTA